MCVADPDALTLTVNVAGDVPLAVEVAALHQVAPQTPGTWMLSPGEKVFKIEAGVEK